ncbi:hypothetical protein M9H77_23315 [Catharanthus roseus]|uniref:Uncharacterized protein n=1 Tax=Catharanthus roseus TaxID=4058 RepID=A0ACC0AVH8_CATRO|nr:hypothetical protein M9H77_23315 [Catharanthus roseus]
MLHKCESIGLRAYTNNMILAEMKKVTVDATTPLEKFLIALFDKARRFDASKSATCDMMTKEAYFESLFEVKRHLEEIASKDSIKDKHNELEKELDMLEKHKQGICSSIRRYEEELKNVRTESWSKKEEILSMENAPFQYNEVVQNLEASRGILAASRHVANSGRSFNSLTSTIVCREIGPAVELCRNVMKLDDPTLPSSSSFGLVSTIFVDLFENLFRGLRNLISELPKNFLFYFVEEELKETSTLEIKG